jgi:hypothetical protein
MSLSFILLRGSSQVPIHVEIKINEQLINTLHIGRLEGGTGPQDVNSYLVVEGQRPKGVDDWHRGETFSHRYGDGAEVCVMKAIEAIRRNNV